MPGIAASTRETLALGAAPNWVEAPENSLALERTWACTSMPITISQSPVTPAMVLALGSSYSSTAGAALMGRSPGFGRILWRKTLRARCGRVEPLCCAGLCVSRPIAVLLRATFFPQSPSKPKEDEPAVRQYFFLYGLERYYVPEGEGPRLEALIEDDLLKVVRRWREMGGPRSNRSGWLVK